MFSLTEILPADLRDAVILDIGALELGEDRYASLAATGRARIIGVEPSPAGRAKLEAKRGPEYSYLPYFLGDGQEASIHVTRFPGCVSLLEPDSRFIDKFTYIGTQPPDGNYEVLKIVKTSTKRLDDIADLPPPDFIKVDVQGGELNIFRHGIKALATATVVESEVEFLPLYKDQPLFCDIQAFMRDQGFHLHKFLDIAGRSLRPTMYRDNLDAATSQVLWADAIFVRDFTRLEHYSDDQLLITALVLHDVYSSFDMAYFMLKEHDARTGGAHAAAYGEKISATPQEERNRKYMNLVETS